MNENSKNWTNYGDVNFLDEGGVQIRATDREDIYDAIIVIPNPENENTVFAGHLTIDISDYRKNAHAEQIATESFGADYTDEQLAVVVAENEGLPELGATAFNDNSSLAAYAMSWEAFEIDKAELEPMLIELGIDIDVQYNSSEKEEITADSIIDIENDIQINDDYNKLDVYVVMDDQTLDRLMKRADMYEKSGYKDFDEIIGSSAIVNLYFVADEKGVDIVLTLDDGEKYHDVTFSEHPDENEFPLSHDESEMIREKLEHFLGKSAVEYLKAEKWKDMDTSDIKQLTAKDITPEDITAMQEAGYKFTDVYDYAKSRNLLLGELMGVKAIYDNRLITYHAEAKDDYGKMYDIDEDTIQELENNILMIDELVAAETESKYHLVVISRDPGEEVLVPVVIRTEDKTLLPFSQMLEEVKALIPEKLEGYATPISETEDLPVEVKTMDKLSMLYDLANDELDMLYALAERDKLYDLADAEFAGTIRRTNGMESDFLDIMRYMGVDLERINEAFHRAESIVTEGIGSEEDKRYQCEVLHGNVRDRFSETLQESVHSISKDSIADGLITQAFVDSYFNEAKTMAAEREPSKPKKEKPSIELN